MIFWVIGLEGCGHHGLHPIANQALSATYSKYAGVLCPVNRIIEDPDPTQLNSRLASYFEKASAQSTHYVDVSFPYGHVRRKLTDQKDIITIYHEFIKYRDVKLIHLVRCPYNTTNSHPEWDGGLLGHAQKLHSVSARINRQLAVFPGEINKLRYEDIPTSAQVLSEIFEVPLVAIRRAIKTRFKPSTKDYKKLLPQKVIDQLVAIWEPTGQKLAVGAELNKSGESDV